MTGRLGGLPDLPLDMPWPEGEGNGPPCHIASGLALPASGTLLFFLFDGRLDDEDCMVHPSDPETRPGSRVPHVPAGTRPPPNSRLSVPTSDAPDSAQPSARPTWRRAASRRPCSPGSAADSRRGEEI
ncbi:hypothetical protein ACFV0H_11580 [Streptomyces erythrochromogenes]|uniref:hypothetical protein n=1 Tax=Streptomyces erythrochromogenes TaxID=285574 RepID=UPI00369E293E